MRRYLQWQGYRVRYVQNVTDIDDDMIMVSRRVGRPIAEIRDENDAIFRQDDATGLKRAAPDGLPVRDVLHGRDHPDHRAHHRERSRLRGVGQRLLRCRQLSSLPGG
ncbi:MAG: hypothetical protein U5Q44_09160 [Dehalococcoidia bacterium]|nr:hypothetical protein [Dehalococcoidia bacterium]